jgi:ketosteroid isomerase-like protein
MRKHLVAFVIVFGWTAGAAARQTSAAGALAEAFVDAWNTHDVRAFGRLYADDADWVTVGGDRHKGVAIEGALAKEHASWARTTTLRASDVSWPQGEMDVGSSLSDRLPLSRRRGEHPPP